MLYAEHLRRAKSLLSGRSFYCLMLACLAMLLAACGGGGGGGESGASNGPVTFAPATVTANVASGTSATITVRATATDVSLFSSRLYVFVVDSAHVLAPGVELAPIDAKTMSATLHTLPTLAPGRYQGSFQVQLCNDANCQSQVRGSPVALPYDLTVSERHLTLSFAPTTVTANVESGTSATITVRATTTDVSLFSSGLYVFVADSARVLAPSVELAPIDATTMSATLHTLPTLAPGRYQGSFQVQLCNDANCQSQVRGSPVALPYDLTITERPLQVAASTTTSTSIHRGAAGPSPVSVSVFGPSGTWTASTASAWLQIASGSGTGAGTFNVSYSPQSLPEGNYTSDVTVRSSDGQTASLSFTLEVLPTQFVLNSGIPSFSAINGAPIAAQMLSFALNNDVPSAWTATNSAPWLIASPLSGTTPGNITLQPDPTRGPLASGTYSADLVLSSTGIASKTVTTQLALSKPTLSAPSAAITLGGPKGRDMTAQSLLVSLNTGINSWPYVLSGLPAWLSSTTAAGSINQAGANLTVAPVPANVTAGSTSATVSMTATVNGDSVVLPLTVNLNADQRRLRPSEWGVAFASSPTGTLLSRTLTVSDNFSGNLAWSASSDAAWLSVTRSGNTVGSASLVLSADASTLPTETLSYANVTVSTSTNGVEPAVVRVALWKSARGLASMAQLSVNYSHIIADKIRPYVYANNGGTNVDVFNAYTAQKIATISNVGAALGQMTVAHNGSRLYALDTAARSLAVVDLDSLTKVATWSLDKAVDWSTSVLAVRPNGVEVVLVGDGTAYSNGRSLGVTSIYGQMVSTANGQEVLTYGARFGLDYSAMSGGVLYASLLNYVNSASGGNLRDVAISQDGTHAYTASGGGVASGGYKCASIDPVGGSFIGALPGGEAYPNNVEVTADGRAICGISGWYAASDFWVHSPNGALIQGYKIAGYARALKDQQMVVTPDGFIVAALTDDPLIAFVPIGGP
jgi:hypothetical protein